MISRSSCNIGHLRCWSKKEKNIVNLLVAAVLIQIFWKFVRKIVLMTSRSTLKMGHLWIKTRSQELKLEKSCSHSSGCSLDPNTMEIDQKGRFDDF
jgi:hypothetical protein